MNLNIFISWSFMSTKYVISSSLNETLCKFIGIVLFWGLAATFNIWGISRQYHLIAGVKKS